MFDKATRKKYRFTTKRGNLSVEQVWDMPLLSRDNFDLETLAQAFDAELATTSKSFVAPAKRNNSDTIAKFNIVKHIIAYKLDEVERAEERSVKAARKKELLKLIKDVDLKTDQGRTREDLMKEFESL
jgi:hypothetical protein